jgi:hypothetical protein
MADAGSGEGWDEVLSRSESPRVPMATRRTRNSQYSANNAPTISEAGSQTMANGATRSSTRGNGDSCRTSGSSCEIPLARATVRAADRLTISAAIETANAKRNPNEKP